MRAEPELTQRRILRFYSPLAVSWIFMAIESPIAIALVSRMPDARVNTAAMLVMFSLALWIESPVIDLLSTSTTLATSRGNYVALSRFVWWLMGGVTLVHGLLALTPLFDVVVFGLLGLEPSVGEATRDGLALMLPWSAMIGWRRYLQGILIRNGRTRLIGFGTGVRVATMAGSCGALMAFAPSMNSTAIAAIALIASVTAEALFIHWASRETIRASFAHGSGAEASQPISMRRLRSFHFPLTATTMVMMLGLPLVAAGLARAPDSMLALAAWQVASTLLFLARTIVFALPEVVIALVRSDSSASVLRSFCVRVGMATSGFVAAVWMLGLDRWFFTHALRAQPEVADVARLAFGAGLLLPILGAFQSYYRGMLTSRHLTSARLWAMLSGMSALSVLLVLGVQLRWPGVLVASGALTGALAVELVVLAWHWQRRGSPLPVTV